MEIRATGAYFTRRAHAPAGKSYSRETMLIWKRQSCHRDFRSAQRAHTLARAIPPRWDNDFPISFPFNEHDIRCAEFSPPPPLRRRVCAARERNSPLLPSSQFRVFLRGALASRNSARQTPRLLLLQTRDRPFYLARIFQPLGRSPRRDTVADY